MAFKGRVSVAGTIFPLDSEQSLAMPSLDDGRGSPRTMSFARAA
jgi:hypothetical protein